MALPVAGGSPHFVDDDRMKQAHRSLYRSFLLLGIGSVLPTFVIFGAVDYFNDIGGGGDINFALNVCYNGCLFVCSVANALWLQKYGFTIRIVWGFVAMGVCMLSIPLLDQLRESHSGVSIEEEMMSLNKYQRAFQGASRVLSTVDEMLQTIINM